MNSNKSASGFGESFGLFRRRDFTSVELSVPPIHKSEPTKPTANQINILMLETQMRVKAGLPVEFEKLIAKCSSFFEGVI